MVFLRDGGRCTFTGTNGRRCNSTWDLQIDHIIPFALGGDDSPGNLRLLCGKHNRLEAERRFGKRQPDGNGRQE
jgi:5-methylcytosine-specific restriction endonuclease McrA